MRLQHVLDQIYNKPWLITESAHAAVARVVEEHLGDMLKAQREGTDICGEAVELDQMQVIDGIAHIPIAGVIGSRLSGFERGSGAVDTAWIEEELDEAEANEDVRAVFLDIDSPGGMVAGTPELATRISQVDKDVYAFTGGMAGSAAYWLASSSDYFFATPTSTIGSIGVFMAMADTSRRAEMAGVKVDVISSGKYKGMGIPGTSLSADQRAHLQSQIDDIASEFKAHVRSMREEVPDSAMEGQAFLGNSALANKLVDEIVSSKRHALQLIG